MGVTIDTWWQDLLERTALEIASERARERKYRAIAAVPGGYDDVPWTPNERYRNNTFACSVNDGDIIEVPIADVLARLMQGAK